MKNLKKKFLVLTMVVAMLMSATTVAYAWPDDDGDPPTDPTDPTSIVVILEE